MGAVFSQARHTSCGKACSGETLCWDAALSWSSASGTSGASGGSFSSRGINQPASVEPICVAVSGAAGQIGYSLLPMIASGGMFGPHQKIILQCLDLNLPTVKENMNAIAMEMQDGNFPLLHRALLTTDDAAAFKDADYALLLGAFPRQDGKDKSEAMEKNVLIFRTMGRAIQEHAKKSCKVLVVGNPANTNALICAHFAPSLPKENFFALTRLDQNRAVAQLAVRAEVGMDEVRNVIIWGSRGKCPDVRHATLRGKPVPEVFSKEEDAEWLRGKFVQEIKQRGANIAKARKASGTMSTARAIVETISDLHFGTRPGEFVSVGVWSDKNPYGVAGGLFYSMPICCTGRGRYRVHPGLTPDNQDILREAEAELLADRELVETFFNKHVSVS